jgi:transcription antitermination factor NusG
MKNSDENLATRIDELALELRKIRVHERKARNLINQLTKEQTRRRESTVRGIIVHDRDGAQIKQGNSVRFLTKGKFKSTWGIVEKVAENRISSRDPRGVLISRAPWNTRVIKDDRK